MKQRCLQVVALSAIVAWPLAAQDAPGESGRRGPRDPAELEAFVDGLMAVMLEELHSAGAVVAVVSGGEVFFRKGYGYADWKAREPVDPETTLFRIGSVSKLFVWLSVMQMVEQGLLDLDVDVNEYLDFEIPATFEKPITLSDIMAHAAGFEDRVIELFGDEPEDVRPLGELLAEQLPARVRPAGDIASYSNHATGMAAHMVEQVSGREWKEYIEERILGPLGMEHTSFRQPLPEALAPHMSRGYSFGSGRYEEEDFEYVPLAPVGAAAASATDIARFMVALLQSGRYGDQRILSEETARLMFSDHHRMDPAVNAMAHGFMDMSRNGVRIIGHGGDTRWFHTGLALFPEHDLGVFVSFNSQGGGAARGRFLDAFVDRYFAVQEVVPTAPDDFAARADRFTGTYMSNRFSHTTIAKLNRGTETVSATDRGTLRALNAEWVEVAPLKFDEEFGPRTLVFREAEDGTITHFFLAGTPIVGWERVPAAENPNLQAALLIVSLATIMIALISPLIGWLNRRWYGLAPERLARIPRAARLTLWWAAALFAIGGIAIQWILNNPPIVVEVSPALGVALLLPVLAALPTLASVAFAIRIWRKREGRPTVRTLYSAASIVLCLLLWQLNVWNLLGWKY